MPTSRQRRGAPKNRRPRTEEPAYTRLARGVVADEEFGRLYRRAMWSFHRAASSQLGVEGEPAADAAAARGLEWFLFGLTLPPQHTTPAEIWIERESEARGWSEATRRDFLALTEGRYGLFRVERRLGGNWFGLTDLADGTALVGWNVAAVSDVEPGVTVAGWMFPAAEGAVHATDSVRPVVMSPGSFVLPEDVAGAFVASGRIPEITAPDVEEALGASLDWLAETASAIRARSVLDEFLFDAAGGGARASHLVAELTGAASPATVVMRLIDELDPLTPTEPLVVMALSSMVWLTAQAKAAIPVRTLQRRGERWIRELQRLLKGADGDETDALEAALPESASRLTEHEVARLRALPQDRTWVAEQRVLEVPARSADGRAYFPEVAAILERPGLDVLALEAVSASEPDLSLLRTLVTAMTSPRIGPARRPATVIVRSERGAARLRTIAQVGIEVRIQYLDADLEEAWRALVDRGGAAGIASLAALEPIGASGYLTHAAGSVAQVQELFAAATVLHAAAPWKTADELRPFAIQPKGHPWPAVSGLAARDEPLLVVMAGTNARQLEVLACLDEDAFEELLSGDEVAVSERASTLALQFHTEDEIPTEVLAETREHRLPLPSREAIPIAERTQPGAPARLASGDELTLLAQVARVLAAFTRLHGRELATTDGEIVRTIDEPRYGRFEVRVAPSLDAVDDE